MASTTAAIACCCRPDSTDISSSSPRTTSTRDGPSNDARSTSDSTSNAERGSSRPSAARSTISGDTQAPGAPPDSPRTTSSGNGAPCPTGQTARRGWGRRARGPSPARASGPARYQGEVRWPVSRRVRPVTARREVPARRGRTQPGRGRCGHPHSGITSRSNVCSILAHGHTTREGLCMTTARPAQPRPRPKPQLQPQSPSRSQSCHPATRPRGRRQAVTRPARAVRDTTKTGALAGSRRTSRTYAGRPTAALALGRHQLVLAEDGDHLVHGQSQDTLGDLQDEDVAARVGSPLRLRRSTTGTGWPAARAARSPERGPRPAARCRWRARPLAPRPAAPARSRPPMRKSRSRSRAPPGASLDVGPSAEALLGLLGQQLAQTDELGHVAAVEQAVDGARRSAWPGPAAAAR